MKTDMMEVLACPMCKTGLTLHIADQDGDEITAGTLTCQECGEAFPVEDGVPNLLPVEYRVETTGKG